MIKHRFKMIIAAFIVFAVMVQSCNNRDNEQPAPAEGRVEFTFEVIDNPDGGRKGSSGKSAGRTEADIPSKVVISIEDNLGNPVYALEELTLFEFNGSYVTEPLILQVGSYKLTEYLVLDDEDATIFATPQEGSDLDYLVADPLPIDLVVSANASTSLAPQVISTEQLTPADFGYTDSNFEFVATYDMLLSVFVQNATTGAFESTDATLTVTATAETTELYNKAIASGIVQVKLTDGYSNYTVQVDKAGYNSYTADFTQAEMKAFFTDPLIVNLFPPAAVPNGASVAAFTGDNYQGAEIAATPSGGFILSANKWGGGTEGFVYDASNTVVGSFSTGHVTEFSTGLAVLDNGEFITSRIVGTNLHAVIYNADGTVKVADQVIRSGANTARNMMAISDGTGYLVLWAESNTLSMQKIDAAGNLVGGLVQPGVDVNQFDNAGTRRRGMEAAMKSDGQFVFVTRPTSNYNNLEVHEFNADLTINTTYQITPTQAGINHYSMVDLNENGEYVITWLRAEDNVVRMAGFSMGGNALFSEVIVGQARTLASDVTVSDNGTVIVSYAGGNGSPNMVDHVIRIYDLTGAPADDEIIAAQVVNQATNTKVTFIDNNNFVVLYDNLPAGYEQFAQKFTY
ncbi:MAG: hypothetical protein R8G66_02360 [Cytophagales bacterium]|nr:hypothetical protein [Cytophagales bacterium]